MPVSLDALSISPQSGNAPTRLLAILHGWGADANDLVPLANLLDIPEYQCLFPNAPYPHPQVPGGRAWYALESSNYQGLEESRQLLYEWLVHLEASMGVPLKHTVLCGFSQGGAMILDVGLNFNLPLAALCSLSGYLHIRPQLSYGSAPPVLMVHGKKDPVVPLEASQKARDELLALGINVDYHELDMGHEIPIAAVQILQQFINAIKIS